MLVTHSIDEAVMLADRVVAVSPRPARVLTDVPIDVPRPRSLASKSDPRFLQCRATLEQALFGSSLERFGEADRDAPGHRMAAWGAQRRL